MDLTGQDRSAGLADTADGRLASGRSDAVARIEAPTLALLDELLRAIRQIDGIANTDTSILLFVCKTAR